MIGVLPAIDRIQPGADSAFAPAGPATAAPEGGMSFGTALANAAARTAGSLGQAEAVSAAALQGQVETREVVDAVMSAEQSLQAAIAIRDKIVQSYLEVSRMAI